MAIQINRAPLVLAIIALVLLTVTLIHQSNNVPDVIRKTFQTGSVNLEARLAHAEKVYRKVVEGRHVMLQDYPDPNDKEMFPARDVNTYFRTPWTIWDFIPASFNCPWETERVGRMGDGGKWVCGMSRYESMPPTHPCVIYSFGIQVESSFEEELLERTHCQVWGYDFSVTEFGKQLKGTERKSRAHFLQAGIGGATDEAHDPPFYSIQDLMAMNGHDHIDIMKMDIEGSEFESMSSLLKHFESEVPVGQLMVEVHLDEHRLTTDEFLEWWETLETAGFRPVWTEPNLLATTLPFYDHFPVFAEYTLINTKDSKNVLLY